MNQKQYQAKIDALTLTGEQIKALREDAGMTQAQFGVLIFVTGRQVRNYESGARNLPPASAQLLGIKLDRMARKKKK